MVVAGLLPLVIMFYNEPATIVIIVLLGLATCFVFELPKLLIANMIKTIEDREKEDH